METNVLTDAERELSQRLPGPPATASIRASNIWIVEWLPSDEDHTGLTLHEWMKKQRQGWSKYIRCGSKQEVISAINSATEYAQKTGCVPVLHLEAHGDVDYQGLIGPDGNGGNEILTWDELMEPLQQLNLATQCNLLVFIAACTGFAGIKAFVSGPLAPAVALVGSDDEVMPSNLLHATKEFYRRLKDPDANLTSMVTGASQEAGTVIFEPEPFAILCYESMIKALLIKMRSVKDQKDKDRISSIFQHMWDEMFMIDLYPKNQKRFGIDMAAIVDMIFHEQHCRS